MTTRAVTTGSARQSNTARSRKPGGGAVGEGLRIHRRLTALGVGPDDPAPSCALCGEDRLPALHVRTGHHVAGHRNDPDLTVRICQNCHAAQHESMLTAGVQLRDDTTPPATMLDRLARMLGGAGVFLLVLGQRLVEWAMYLPSLVAALDTAVPEWRRVAAGVPGPEGITVPAATPSHTLDPVHAIAASAADPVPDGGGHDRDD